MVTESSFGMLSELGARQGTGDSLRVSNGNLEDDLGNQIEMILREQRSRDIIDRERDLNIYRSGSAPPTVEGSISAVGSLFRDSGNDNFGINRVDNNNGVLSEEEIRSHPVYLSYYYSHDNINPRLPPPLLSREDWRVAQRFQSGTSSFGGIGDRRKNALANGRDNRSLFSLQPGRPEQNGEGSFVEPRKVTPRSLTRQPSAEWVERDTDGLIGLAGVGLGARRRSLADMLQDGLCQPASASVHLSRPTSRSAYDDALATMGVSDSQVSQSHNAMETSLHSEAATPGLVRVQSLGSTISQSFASDVNSSLSRSTTPEPQLVGRSLGPGLPPVGGRICPIDKRNVVGSSAFDGLSSDMTHHDDIAATLSGLSLSSERLIYEDSHVQSRNRKNYGAQPNFLVDMSNGDNHNLHQRISDKSEAETLPISSFDNDFIKDNGIVTDLYASKIGFDRQVNFPKRTYSSANLYSKINSAGTASLEGSDFLYQRANMTSMDSVGITPTGYSMNQRPNSAINNHLDRGHAFLGVEGQSLNGNGNQVGSSPHFPGVDPFYGQLLQEASDYATHAAATLNNPSFGRNILGASQADSLGFQKAYLGALLAQQRQQYAMPFLGKFGDLNHAYYGSSEFGHGMPYLGNQVANSVLPPAAPGSTLRQHERSRFPYDSRSSAGGLIGSWHSNNGGNVEEGFPSSLLEEFKNNKTRCFELFEIIDHVVEFSADQYGSRFIQQKLETASVEEKNKIFPEIIPHARTLMTDVFGNYVIQKFFEHGTESQRKELASQLTGHVLPLSLQMYGCRVIQKALEVVDVDQQTRMVAELDGAVMKCVRDQNGNHVIQKCIECVPQDRIQFIISAFYGQVVALSTHPYGCRVIQRVLEHCNDLNTQHFIMDEIMQSVCTLAQDQYGNYVVQHILEHGKPLERSTIISKLAGHIVKMSQQKFASNVIEKCLTFGCPEERQLLVNEMLGSTEENEPLQAMMKDPFANYVVQKVLETCDDKSRELILSRIKVHLNALKRYTYGKHIVARVEKLITTGERRMGISSSSSSS